MKNNNVLAHQLVHDLSFDMPLGSQIKDYDKKVEIVKNFFNEITAPKNIIEMYSKLEDDIYDWCIKMVNLIPRHYTDEMGRKCCVRNIHLESAEIYENKDMIRIVTCSNGGNDYIYMFLPLSLYIQGDKQKAANYLYNASKEHFDVECEKEKRLYEADLAEFKRLKEKLNL